MKNIHGCGTALVTPFTQEGKLDLESLERLIAWQLEEGIDFLVPCGTTGESVTLSRQEYRQVLKSCVRLAGGRVPVVAGAGSNSTAHALELARLAEEEGVDAILSVTPYYNKPTQEGLFLHYRELASQLGIPVILYNVPGRTGVNLLPETILRLRREEEGILGVKEASGNLGQIMTLLQRRSAGLTVLSGDDQLTLPMIALGAEGVISVAANLIPGPMTKLVREARQGNLDRARELHYHFLELMNLNFIESNPIPVKYALSRMGAIREAYRLPLAPLSAEGKKRMDIELDRLGLLRAYAREN